MFNFILKIFNYFYIEMWNILVYVFINIWLYYICIYIKYIIICIIYYYVFIIWYLFAFSLKIFLKSSWDYLQRKFRYLLMSKNSSTRKISCKYIKTIYVYYVRVITIDIINFLLNRKERTCCDNFGISFILSKKWILKSK